mmetsp:Transcript_36821/g.85575  ORF Transcript_36821/g.85575 Transcript_36821/m.85575 type:complete len:350 (+) Transcript_36821:1698-2747(+)
MRRRRSREKTTLDGCVHLLLEDVERRGGPCKLLPAVGQLLVEVGRLKAVGVFVCDEVCGEVPRHERLVGQDGAEERDVAGDATDDILVKCRSHPTNRLGSVLAVCDELGDERIIVDGDVGALVDTGVDTDVAVLATRLRITGESSDRGQEVVHGVLRIHSALERPAVALDVCLGERELVSGGDLEHELHQVQTGDVLCDGMLHLQSRIHLQKVEVLVLVNNHFDGAGGVVVHCLGEGNCLFSHGFARLWVENNARRLLDHLLVPPLNRTLPFVQIHSVAVFVRNELDFNMPGVLDKLLDEDAVVVEAGARFVGGKSESFLGLLVVPGDAHSFATATSRRLDHHGIPDIP